MSRLWCQWSEKFHHTHLKNTLLLHHLLWGKRLSWNTSRGKKSIPARQCFSFIHFPWNSPLSFGFVELFSFFPSFAFVIQDSSPEAFNFNEYFKYTLWFSKHIYSSGNFYMHTVLLLTFFPCKFCLASWNKNPSINFCICPYQRLVDAGILRFLILNNLLAQTSLMPFYHQLSYYGNLIFNRRLILKSITYFLLVIIT